ncbi:MAG: hypothetical protein N3E42_05515 [Candidatus Bipolaricaulota bacterium]|nr:hypothetical protein [Candidatus Bipolaricaulota bacterium]MCX8103873.1 hypothetical protein [Candidatus Bipolaricaulota bacterium]MDW8141553.1 hypothetical protein [Candidatus Bipolaricaulota bacterium]
MIAKSVQTIKELWRGENLYTFVTTQVQEIVIFGNKILRASG